ncbi:MAG: hypothetical protein QGG26_17535, partial [Candidatus Undinarchaeales archaeon]|nr:hypothetical protein [Candidatus Undinarchaeales archaeon]
AKCRRSTAPSAWSTAKFVVNPPPPGSSGGSSDGSSDGSSGGSSGGSSDGSSDGSSGGSSGGSSDGSSPMAGTGQRRCQDHIPGLR